MRHSELLFAFFSSILYFVGVVEADLAPITCVSCDSTYDKHDCFFDATKLAHCQSASGQCYTFSENGILRRGCVGDNVIKNVRQCHEASDECSICSSDDLCNDRDIRQEFCHYHSPGSLLQSSQQLCPITVRSLGCYLRVNEKNREMSKGCVASLSLEDKKLCRKNGPECKVCSGHNCNERDYFMECIDCDSETDSNCLEPDVNTKTKQCHSLNTQCFTIVGNIFPKDSIQYHYHIRRGCSDHRNFRSRDCRPDNTKCEQCADALCNMNAIRNTCNRCGSPSNDRECDSNPKLYENEMCSLKHPLHSNFSDCFYQKNPVKRGCLNSLPSSDECHATTGNCQRCTGTNCNQKLFHEQTCYSCNGTVDKDCAIFNENINKIKCPNYSSSCLIGIDSAGNTHRGCSMDHEVDKRLYSHGFKLCFDEECNNGTFPVNRIHCYHCNGGADCLYDEGSTIPLEPCDPYSANDQCFAYFDERNGIHRGCLNEKTKARYLCEQNPDRCRTCHSQGCNWINRRSN